MHNKHYWGYKSFMT